ncbi:hypothetical protein BJ742DRAFT_895976 [Cladochytrium replicatum]|nr:hypothetical protein BJ742DRAFT_895976 [Cladochytrium replicatum]
MCSRYAIGQTWLVKNPHRDLPVVMRFMALDRATGQDRSMRSPATVIQISQIFTSIPNEQQSSDRIELGRFDTSQLRFDPPVNETPRALGKQIEKPIRGPGDRSNHHLAVAAEPSVTIPMIYSRGPHYHNGPCLVDQIRTAAPRPELMKPPDLIQSNPQKEVNLTINDDALPTHALKSPPVQDGLWEGAKHLGSKLLGGIDTVGNFFADMLGITTPRYAEYMEDARRYQAWFSRSQLQQEESFAQDDRNARVLVQSLKRP